MPTPYGSRGGPAFSADELRVLRGALAVAVQPSPASAPVALELIEAALTAGCPPHRDDLAALRARAAERAGAAKRVRRAELLQRCADLADREPARWAKLAGTRLHVVPRDRGAPDLAEEKPGKTPGKDPAKEPPREPRREPRKPSPPPGRRPVPTPGEVFPPRRRPSTPPEEALPA